MKEFTSQTGGRFTYVDDLINLQELALAFSEIFTDCDNFIVSGCEVNGNSISAGVVYLNGKLRTVDAVPSITGGWPQFIYEVNENKNVPYASGGEKVGRQIWGASIGRTVPLSVTPLTNAVPKAIQINFDGGPRMKDVWFGKYALLLNPKADSQTINGDVNLRHLSASGMIKSNSRFTLPTPNGVGSLYISENSLILEVSRSYNKTMRIEMDADYNFHFISNGLKLATISSSGMKFNAPIICSRIDSGNIVVINNDIYNDSTASDKGVLNINVVGLNGSTSYFRTTNIGSGKGDILLSVSGATKTITASGQLIITGNSSLAQVYKGIVPKSDPTYRQYIEWQDSTNTAMSHIGFLDDNTMIFAIKNIIGSILINGVGGVNIGPTIMENGTPLNEKYALRSELQNIAGEKVDMNNVYTKSETYSTVQADNKFAIATNGLSQFIIGGNNAQALCNQIGAIHQTTLNDYVRKDKFLSDMALTDSQKEIIRNNIGAAANNEAQKDTGWVSISGTDLYARQIGNIVSIQGELTLIHSGQAFVIPNNIQAPKYTVGYDAPMQGNSMGWSCRINAGSKSCTVMRCNCHDCKVPVSIIYMV